MKVKTNLTTGEKIIIRCFDLMKSLSEDKKREVKNIIENFILEPDNLDLLTISKLEVIFGEELFYVPTKQQWRKIKLQRLNEISKNNEIYN